MRLDTVLTDVFAELQRARMKFPDWPDSRIEQAGIVAEEAGEALKTALDLRKIGKGGKLGVTSEDLRKEWVQTAAMAIRALTDGDFPMPPIEAEPADDIPF